MAKSHERRAAASHKSETLMLPGIQFIAIAAALRAEAGCETGALRFTGPHRDISDIEQIDKVMDWRD